jgi:hypothetical protein
VPGWHESTLELQKQNKIRMVGIIQEQHPERARLFMQWKEMDWPILVDSLDLLEVTYVPITVLIDEHGIVRSVVSPRDDPLVALEGFVDREFEAPDEAAPALSTPPDPDKLRAAMDEKDASDWRDLARTLLLWDSSTRLDAAIDAYARAIALEPDDGWTRFRSGVAFRARADSDRANADDFSRAIEEWTAALEIDPNNYIWRRRIQQYGPRLDKPYPFYDWVAEARRDVEARGGTPVTLTVEPRGAELALPAREFATEEAAERDLERDDRIHRDPGKLVNVRTVVVPGTKTGRVTGRVHLEFEPVRSADAHWNNEVGGLVFWLDPPDGWSVDRHRVALDNPAGLGAASEEVRRLEFEVQGPAAGAAKATLPAYALYYVCEGVGGACLYRRQDVEIHLSFSSE